MLALEVSVEANEQRDDADSEKCGAEGFPNLAQAQLCVGGSVGIDADIEAEELGDGYADGGEGEGGPEPG